jgi:hypothetical protein
MGSADPAQAPTNLLSNIKLGANRFAAAGIQAVSDVAGATGDAFSAAREWDRNLPSVTDVIRDLPEGGHLAAIRDFAADTVSPIIGRPGFLNPEGSAGPPGVTDGQNADSLDRTDADIESIQERMNTTLLMDQQALELMESGTLDEQSQFAVSEFRLQLADQLDQIQLDLEKAKHQLDVQDVLFDFESDQIGFENDLGPLEEALQMEGGVGLQTMQAIKDIANNAALDAAEKGEAIDLVMARASFSQEIVDGISEMVQNRDDLQKFNEMADVELANSLGVASFFDPMFPNVIETDPVVRANVNFNDVVEQTVIGDWLSDEATDQQYEQYLAVRDMALSLENARAEELNPLYQALATTSGIDYETWRNTVSDAIGRTKASEAAAEAAIDAKSLPPGSESMAIAIANAGHELIEAGVDPEAIRLIANYPGLHAIIKVKSNGRAGAHGEGTIRGIGGLTEAMYENLMGEVWHPNRGMQWELQALLLYIMRGFGGDPIAAMDFYRNTGEWGGVQSMGGDEVVGQTNRQGE